VGRTQPGDVVLCAGEPRGGVDLPYAEGDPEIASISTVQALAALDEVHEILPAGSKGVVYEAVQLAKGAGLRFWLAAEPPAINLYGSAGAATAVLVSTEAQHVDLIRRSVSVPVYLLGTVENTDENTLENTDE
jgi:hypothetical protein